MDSKTSLRVIHTESSINFGGQEMRILRQMRWLLDHAHESWLLARDSSAIYQEAQHLGLPCHPVAFRGSVNPLVTRAVQRFWHRHRADVLDCHSMRDASAVMPLSWLGYPIVHSQHICKRLKEDWMHRVIWRIGSRVTLAASRSIADRLAEQRLVPPAHVRVVGEAVDLSVYRPDIDGSEIRRTWRIPPEARLVTVVAMIRPDKAPHFLVRAAKRIALSIPQAWFMIVGAPTRPEFGEQLRAELAKSPVRDRIVLAGFQKQVEQYMAASDVIAVTSTIEAQSLVVPQAFAMKRVVVAPALGGIPELIQHGKTGYLYPPCDVEKLADTVVTALQSDNTEILSRAYEFACRQLTMDSQMGLTLEIYGAAINR